MKPKNLLAGLGLYVISSAMSFGTFNFVFANPAVDAPVSSEDESTFASLLDIPAGEPRDQACPLNGQLFTQTEQEAWAQRRPLAVMIENHPEARPQSGLGVADIVFEAVAEGGVTRFMAVLYCDAVSDEALLAPIRSARTAFVDWASGFNEPIYAHIGGANCSADKGPQGAVGPCKSDKRVQAIEQIESYGWRLENDIDGMSVGLPVFYRDKNRLGKDRNLATEHTVITSTERLWTEAEERDWTNLNPEGDEWSEGFSSWDFTDPAAEGSRGSVASISYHFWDTSLQDQFSVQWNYDTASNTYARVMGGEPHLDLNTNEQIKSSNVIVLFTDEETSVDELKHNYYETIGQGDALLFRNGQAEEITWAKRSRTAPLTFTDSRNNPVELTRGKIWISVLDTTSEVSY